MQLQKQVDTLNKGGGAGAGAGKRSELEVAREHLRKLKAENTALRSAAQQQNEAAARMSKVAQSNSSKSAVCLIS